MKVSKKTKYSFFFLFIIILLTASIGFSLSPTSTIYITSGDVIKNFKLESFDNSDIGAGYTTDRYGNKLVFGAGAYWEIAPDSIELQYFLQEDDIIYFKYDVIATNTINIYTNCKTSDVVEFLSPVKDRYRVATYKHLAIDGGTRYSFYGDLFWTHYDFYPTSDILEFNYDNNYFSGDLVMSFDIDSTPIPNSVVDIYGNSATKQFSHISIVSIYTDEALHGFLSDETPVITGTTPDKYDPFDYNSDSMSGRDASQPDKIVSYSFDPATRLFAPYFLNSFDSAITPQPAFTSLNPTTKLGTALWDPQTENRSAQDVKFTYHLTSLSPVVKRYSQQLAYSPKIVIAQDVWSPTLFDWLRLVINVNEQTASRQTETEDIAIQVSNRYIQTGIKAKFSVYSSYKIEALVDQTDVALGLPAEYFDYLAWSSAVDGFGGGQGESEVPNLLDPLSVVVIIVIIIAVLGIGFYVFRRYTKTAKKMMGSSINISLGK